MVPALDDEFGYRTTNLKAPRFIKGGCCFLLILFGLLFAARITYVQVTDHRAVAAAKRRCNQDSVLQIRQADVWRDYVRRLPPTEPYGDFLVEQRRIQAAMGLSLDSVSAGDDHDLVLLNAGGEVARLSYVRAISVGFSIEGVPSTLFSCLHQSPQFYKYGYAF